MAPIVRITVIEKGKPTHSHLFQKNLVVVGKHPSSDLQLENSLVSRQHALLRIVEQSMEFEDLESTNGSFLDGRRIKTEALKNGDQVNVGPYSLTFNLDGNSCTSRASTGSIKIKGSTNILEITQDGSDLGICS